MDAPRRLSRRKFMGAAAAAAAVPSLPSCGGGGRGAPHRFFTAAEARTVEAICDRIVPADGDPGAVWAGALEFLDRQLAGPYADLQGAYRKGLAGADASAAAMFGGKAFADLGPAERDEVLRAMEVDAVPGDAWKGSKASDFFKLIAEHTMQSFYGDPRHGGNRDMVAWKMLGIPYPPVRGRRKNGPARGGTRGGRP